ncbi:MAG: S1 family peptidase [Candidatus Tectomicrobia bacterium]|nr:S1 family peptidase [Candidatus Tectomicrobia bacterium]
MPARLRLLIPLALVTALLAFSSTATAESTLPKLGASGSSADLRSVPGTVEFSSGYAVPLRADKPSWLTPELEQRALASPGTPLAAPTDAPLPSEVGIRPGSWMISPAGCTMNFVFRKSGALGIGTAGHCVDKTGQHVILLTLAPGNGNPVLVDIGTVVARADGGVGNDFALVSIYPSLWSWVSPTTAVVGGPCGAYTGSGLVSVSNPVRGIQVPFVKGLQIGPTAFGPETVWHYGHGLAIGTGGTPRAGAALIWGPDYFAWDSPSIFGDSGSPVRITDLKAAGNLTHLVADSRFLRSFVAGMRISTMLNIASG